MRSFLILLVALANTKTDLNAAEAGMPQLDPTYWASQAFWLILVFTILYIAISKFYLPKIKDNLDNRENKIKEDLETRDKYDSTRKLSPLKKPVDAIIIDTTLCSFEEQVNQILKHIEK